MSQPAPRVAVKELPADIRHRIFQGREHQRLKACILAEAPGVISGMNRVEAWAAAHHVDLANALADGREAAPGQVVATVWGSPFNLVRAEEVLIGELSKTSGVATRARQALEQAAGRFRVVCGAFKKMPAAVKFPLRQAVADGGLDVRMAPHPFVYLDKNYVRILGGVARAMAAVAPLERPVVIQLRGESAPIGREAVMAAQLGAANVMIDTGRLADLDAAARALKEAGLRAAVQLTFAGNLRISDLAGLGRDHDLDAVDIGYDVVDAPCLPLRFDVAAE